MILIVLLIGTFVKSDSTSKEIHLWFDSKRSFGMLFILVAASNESFTENSFTVNGFNKLAKYVMYVVYEWVYELECGV